MAKYTCGGCGKEYKTAPPRDKHQLTCTLYVPPNGNNNVVPPGNNNGVPPGNNNGVPPGNNKGVTSQSSLGASQALALLLADAPDQPSIGRTKMSEIMKGMIGTPEAPFIGVRLAKALQGGPLSEPRDTAAVTRITSVWTDRKRAWLSTLLAKPAEPDGTILVPVDDSGLIYETLATLIGEMLEAPAGSFSIKDLALDPGRVAVEAEVSRLKKLMKIEDVPSEDPPPALQVPNMAWMKRFMRGRGRKDRNGKNPKACFTCGEVGHLRKDCPQNGKPTKKNRPETDKPKGEVK